MKRLNLGKTIVLFLIIFTTTIFAKVTASLSQNAIYKGDIVDFTISANGDNIKFPTISNIGGFRIVGIANSSSTTIINGNVSKQISKTYSFAPTHSLTIPSFIVNIDGKDEKTKELKLDVIKPSTSKVGDPFILEASINKNSVYVGEEALLTLTFKQKLNAKVAKIELNKPASNHLWIKNIGGVTQSTQGDYIVTTYKYLLFPQKEGAYILDNLFASIAVIQKDPIGMGTFFNDPFFDSFNTTLAYKKVYAPQITLKVKPLPSGSSIYGDFNIKAEVDKREVDANKPVNLTITIKGDGNIDDIKSFNIDIPQAVVYANKPQIETVLQNGNYKGVFTQKITFIADRDFTIPAIEFSYFSKKDKKIVKKATKPIKIKVNNTQNIIQNTKSTPIQKLKQPKLKQPQIEESKQKNSYILFFIGMIFGSVFTIIIMLIKQKNQKTKKEPKIISQLKKAKNDNKKLFELLLPYKNQDNSIDEVLEKLEQNIYGGKTNNIDIKKVIEYFYYLD